MKKEKIKQIETIEIPKLVIMAQSNGIVFPTDIAKWIISVSAYWKSKGYTEIMRAIDPTSSGYAIKN